MKMRAAVVTTDFEKREARVRTRTAGLRRCETGFLHDPGEDRRDRYWMEVSQLFGSRDFGF